MMNEPKEVVETRAKVELPRLSKPYQQKQLAERITSLVG